MPPFTALTQTEVLYERVHFALRRKMLKPPIARLPAIKMDFINRPSGKTDYICETKVH